MIYTLGELFCGAGGLGLGATLAQVQSPTGEPYGIAPTWANDYDPHACATYARNLMPDHPEHIVCAPVERLDWTQRRPVDAVTFGFPCNDFSLVGEHQGLNGHFGGLYRYGVQAVRFFQPAWFLAENVSGLQSANHGRAFQQILAELAAEGYRLVAHTYHFEQYGIPQKRHRIIVVGIREDLPVAYRVPAPTTPTPDQWMTAEQALHGALDVPWNNERTRHAPRVVELLEHLRPGDNAWSETLPERLRLDVKGAKLSQIYKRLKPDEPAYTVTGSGGGGTHIYHWKEPRALTNRERARLQTFPDDFVFEGTKEHVRKQIGMAVPPLGAKVIFEAVLKTMAGISYDWVTPNIPGETRPSRGSIAVEA